MLNIELLF
jgi:hypothetical protein